MKINERFEIITDAYNFILRESHTTSKGKLAYNDRYYPTLEMALNEIITRAPSDCYTVSEAIVVIDKARESIARCLKEYAQGIDYKALGRVS
jgi:hypothetical protein